VVWSRAWVILGLSGLAVTQPLLDLFGKNPEFFVAGHYTRLQIVVFALLIAVVPALVGIALTAVASFVDRRAGTVVFVLVTAVLGAALMLAVLRTVGVDTLALVFALAVVAGVGFAVLVLKSRGARLFASYLAVANLVFVGSFLLFSPTADLVAGESGAAVGSVDVPPLQGPVVVIVLDELPAATIMRADGSINAERYPGFAALASVSTWFRNTSSHSNHTQRAVPAILTGNLPEDGDLPIFQDHPRNLFTLLGGEVPVHRYESVTDLCPSSLCEAPPHQPLSQAIEDACVVYGHRLLPSSLRDELPPIDSSWGDYGSQGDVAADPSEPGDETGGSGSRQTHLDRAFSHWRARDADERSPLGQASVLSDEIAAIDGTPSLHFVHVVLPHFPFLLSRTGATTSYLPSRLADPNAPGYDFRARLRFQLHSMQVGAADTLVGELVDHLRALPSWEQTLLVVTSDHGDNHTPPDLGRVTVTPANAEEVYRVPLFIKAPGQVDGEVRDDNAHTIDVLPSIVDLVDAEVDWRFDGHSLYDGTTAHTASRVSTDVDSVLAIAARRAEQFPYGDDWTALAAVGANGDLVGKRVDSIAVGEPSRYRASFRQQDLFSDLPTADGKLPLVLAGDVGLQEGPEPKEPPELLAAVNGVVAGVVGGYQPNDGGWGFTGYVADFYREGANTVVLYEVSDEGGVPTLHPIRPGG
jgi:hypothetical protein